METKVYLINKSNLIEADMLENCLTDDELFMDEAERQGSVYSLSWFVYAFNEDIISVTNGVHYIKII